MKARKNSPAPTPAVFAVQLLGVWNRISFGHVALGAGCSCGVASSDLKVRDFEEQILDYLRDKHGPQPGSISSLLADVARRRGRTSMPLLLDLQRTFDSFEQQHLGR